MSAPLWLEVKYINLLSNKLLRFHKVDEYTYVFRCPICNDSAKDEFKTRGYIYQNSGHLKFKCHNCGYSSSFYKFLENIDPFLFDEFKLEILKERGSIRKNYKSDDDKIFTSYIEIKKEKNILENLKCVADLSDNHPVKIYVNERKIPIENQKDIYLTIRFMEWINTIIPDKFLKSQLKKDEPRLVIPFYTADKKIFAVAGRSFKKNSIKYITIKFDENQNKIYGLDNIDSSKRVYVVEGPIDSFFLDNSIAFAGSSGYIPDFEDCVIILDNEPRNREIVKLMSKFISQGRKICIWPNSIIEKDLNEMIINGYSKEKIKEIIDNNTFDGFQAKLRFSEWKVIKE